MIVTVEMMNIKIFNVTIFLIVTNFMLWHQPNSLNFTIDEK